MILYPKWASNLGSSIQMDLSYATIPTCENTFVTLHQEKIKIYHVEDSQDPMNDLVYYEEDLGSYMVLTNEIAPQENVSIAWKMNFDGTKSRIGVGVGIVFISPKVSHRVMLSV
jgi:hypothetical protein